MGKLKGGLAAFLAKKNGAAPNVPGNGMMPGKSMMMTPEQKKAAMKMIGKSKAKKKKAKK